MKCLILAKIASVLIFVRRDPSGWGPAVGRRESESWPTEFNQFPPPRIGANIQRNQEISRRGDVERANQNAFMAERGYTIEVVPQ
jgi:hypothetical protein